MDLNESSQKLEFSPSDSTSDPENEEISEGEDEDDDRNHKHRKRETGSQSLDGDNLDQVLTRPNRKRKPFENGYPHRERDPLSGETWKNFSSAADREFPSRFEKRRVNRTSFLKAPPDLNQKMSGNNSLSGEAGPVRGRGLDPLSWSLHNSRLGLFDVASQIVPSGHVPSGLLGGRGLPNISNAHSASWNTFGLVPGISNGGLDGLHSFGLHGALRPPISPAMGIGIPQQRCRDFEERGFCLRGDMCPMEHGINRIVIEDVQGLSQFNLPVSLPGPQLLRTSGTGVLPVMGTSSNPIVKSKNVYTTSSNREITENGLDHNGGLMGHSMLGGSDVYDPDQPLWTNNNIVTSAAFLEVRESDVGVRESLLNVETSGQMCIESYEGYERQPASASTAVSQNSSGRGKLVSSKNRSGHKEKLDQVNKSLGSLEPRLESEISNPGLRDISHKSGRVNVGGNGPQGREVPPKTHRDPVSNFRKPSQKALRTLFVNGVPQNVNKKDALLAHFQKFGQVIDIYIPLNSERAFVQFLKQEEAEAALTAPDAVMGNRFIKVWWANRDNTTPSQPLSPTPSQPFLLDGGKENYHCAGSKDSMCSAVGQVPVYERVKTMNANVSKTAPLQQKKLENLEFLKEELRKKQEMLDKKRNEFKLQLDKLEKQSVSSKEMTVDQAKRRVEGETTGLAKSESSLATDVITEIPKSTEHAVPRDATANPAVVIQPASLRPSICPLASIGARSAGNPFKLDNRTTTFRTVSPLPPGLANVAALEEHFSPYGDISSVELEKESDDSPQSGVSARISFTTRRSAEKAFLNGKHWQGHNLQLKWLTSVSSARDASSSGNPNVLPNYAGQSPGHATPPSSQKSDTLASSKPENMAREVDAELVDKEKDSASVSSDKEC